MSDTTAPGQVPFAVATTDSVPLNDGSGQHTVMARLTPVGTGRAVRAALGEVADTLDKMAANACEEEHLGLTIAAQFVREQAR